MKFESFSRIRRPLRILLSISVILAGLCLMWACLRISLTGDHTFSRKAVAEAFRLISLPVYLCLGLTVLSLLAQLIPCPVEKQTLEQPLQMTLARMQERIDLTRCPDELRHQVQTLRSTRKLYNFTGRTVLVLSSILFLIYGLNSKNYHPSLINASMIRAMIWLIPCIFVPFVLFLFIDRKNRASMSAELQLLKSAPKESQIIPPKHRRNRRRIFILRMAMLALGFVFLVYGFFAGGSVDVLTKAANICTECIGLG